MNWGWSNVVSFWASHQENVVHFIIKLVIALVVMTIGLYSIRFIGNLIHKGMSKRHVDPLLPNFVRSLVRIGFKVVLFVWIAHFLGFNTASLVTIIGAAGLAIGLALQNTLGNFAGGIIILILKPFKSGDFIHTQGEEGFVEELKIFNTYLKTWDNKSIIIPNGSIINNNIINYTKQQKRRVDIVVGISYGDDLKKAKTVLQGFAKDHPKILQNEEIFIGLGALADSSVNINFRVWVKTEDYWEVFYHLQERIYTEFGDHNLNFPFPQMDLHVKDGNTFAPSNED